MAYDSDFARQEVPTSLLVTKSRVQNKNSISINSVADDGMIVGIRIAC